MFKFDFNVEDLDEEISQDLGGLSNETTPDARTPQTDVPETLVAAETHSLEKMLSKLPDSISYSFIPIQLENGSSVNLPKRELFDARLQLLSSDEDSDDALRGLGEPSDLLAGIYEGGFKTWECSLDLASTTSRLLLNLLDENLRVFELGCGTAIPSLFVLHSKLSQPVKENTKQKPLFLHVQDYNKSVLELSTLPNLILTWYFSDAAKAFRSGSAELEENEGELELSPELLSAFKECLSTYQITLAFTSGAWDTLVPLHSSSESHREDYDLILTSETIYRSSSLPSLIRTLRACAKLPPVTQTVQTDLADPVQKLALNSETVTLVAAKVVYFGVGGSISDFIAAIRQAGGEIQILHEHTGGVGRQVLQIRWLR
ncbi:hypothetical protein SISNIDRAFT_482108 [Sistotremastrum niveocremeum HHB9708]|uniref:protein-histidine N-methyltransferase n=1 Tax=Sistotremastrum niveocremeum HHB9708 TaxID=1314777 RepID=A0A164YRQ1_9AGAM|nr:hypothetical protein SISNIDRAFT_482108 [Sistotremastrum niveocremeum HHB9708]